MHTNLAGEAARVMVLAATNFPWDIDEALRRCGWFQRWEQLRRNAARALAASVEHVVYCLRSTQVVEG